MLFRSVDVNGRVMGIHKGLWNFTTGQRRGLGIANSEPLYVVRLEKNSNRVIVGTREYLNHSSFMVRNINWITVNSISKRFTATVRTRASHPGKEAVIELINSYTVKVNLTDGGTIVSPGQSAVFYDGETVTGGGIIEEVSGI